MLTGYCTDQQSKRWSSWQLRPNLSVLVFLNTEYVNDEATYNLLVCVGQRTNTTTESDEYDNIAEEYDDTATTKRRYSDYILILLCGFNMLNITLNMFYRK